MIPNSNTPKVINAELISSLLKLDQLQQERVLEFINELINNDPMVKRAEASIQDYQEGKVISSDQFTADFEEWKNKKRNLG